MDRFVIRSPATTPRPNAVNPNQSLNQSFKKSPMLNDGPINPGPCIGFDKFAGKRWIYPNNMSVRGYQKRAVEKALFANAMIVLPTGFGKTFIAAVVMYNFYRWYPEGKIIFVAPTRPLVNQQISECKKISGIPSSDCVELTGSISKNKREIEWERRRVFFATPQVIENDIESQILPAKQVRCLVIDEAHRAQGDYSYVTIVRQLQQENKNGFRILALSATPGSDIERVRQVIINLFIGDLVFRSENSIDLMQYKNEKTSKAWTVELVGKHKEFVERYIKLCDPIIKELYRRGLTYSGDSIDKVAKFTLLNASTKLRSNEGTNFGTLRNKLIYYCTVGITLSHCFELLTLYGIRVFYSAVMHNLNEPRSNLRTALASNADFDILLQDIRNMFREDVEIDISKKPNVDLLLGHPKIKVVKDLLIKHFNDNQDKKETRAIVFTKYRDSVYDIIQALKAYDPIIKAGIFVGQGAGSGAKRKSSYTQSANHSPPNAPNNPGMKQKEQLQMIQDFKSGIYNVLVATCVAEEGLDIGEIDLIICYDTTSSPISNTQRRGRTGRKRSGDVETLLTKGYEEKKLRKAAQSKRQVEDQLFNKDNYMQTRYRDSPRMVPLDINPICLEQKIFPTLDDEEEEEVPVKKRRRQRKVDKDNDNDDEEKLKLKKGRKSAKKAEDVEEEERDEIKEIKEKCVEIDDEFEDMFDDDDDLMKIELKSLVDNNHNDADSVPASRVINETSDQTNSQAKDKSEEMVEDEEEWSDF